MIYRATASSIESRMTRTTKVQIKLASHLELVEIHINHALEFVTFEREQWGHLLEVKTFQCHFRALTCANHRGVGCLQRANDTQPLDCSTNLTELCHTPQQLF